MGGAWSTCLPCAGGGTGAAGGGSAGAEGSAAPGGGGVISDLKKASLQRHLSQTSPVLDAEERAPLGDLEEDDLDDLDDEPEDRGKGEAARDGGTQHRLSPRLHDIEEEDDEEGRVAGERYVTSLKSSMWLIALIVSVAQKKNKFVARMIEEKFFCFCFLFNFFN